MNFLHRQTEVTNIAIFRNLVQALKRGEGGWGTEKDKTIVSHKHMPDLTFFILQHQMKLI